MSSPATITIVAPSGFARLRKYLRIYRVSLTERLVYRGDFFLSTILRFLPMVTTILLWHAIFAGAALIVLSTNATSTVGLLGSPMGLGPLLAASALNPELTGDVRIAGFTLRQMVAYLLLVHISRMFSSMPGLAPTIARDIREGTIKKYLLQPLDMQCYLLAYRAAHKTAYIATTSIPYGILFLCCYDYFRELASPSVELVAAYIASLLLAFVIGYFFELCLGMVGFWFLEISSFMYVINTVNFFISGQMFPLDLLPDWLSVPLKLLPFKYLAYFPAAVLVGKVQGAEIWQGLLAALAWAVAFVVLARILYRMGLRRYSAFGG
jgi:ABC-2 type transport system permease protein